MKLNEWTEKVGIPCKAICEERGVPWQVCWAQARLESGRGTNILAKSFNFWGVQPRSVTGHTHKIRKKTTEYDRRGKRKRDYGTFCGWDNIEQAANGYCSFVLRNRYTGAARFVDQPLRWMTYVAGMGYATLRTDKYVVRFRKRMVKLAKKLPQYPGLMPPEIDENLATSLVKIGAEHPGEARWAVTQFEAATDFRELPFEVIEFDEEEICV